MRGGEDLSACGCCGAFGGVMVVVGGAMTFASLASSSSGMAASFSEARCFIAVGFLSEIGMMLLNQVVCL